MEDASSLVAKVKKGDREAFNELYKLHYLSLRSYAELLLDAEEAEDVVQDVFLTIWIHRDGLDETLSLRGYLLRSVYNTALNVLKRRNRSNSYCSEYEREIEEMGYQHYDPDASEVIRRLYNQELRQQIEAAINSLPPRCREVFSLSYLNDVPCKEIGDKLGISLSTVENHIYTALKQLRERLKEERAGLFLFLLVGELYR